MNGERIHVRQVMNRWIIIHPDNPTQAWSGSRWVEIMPEGLPIDTQVSNFATKEEAIREAALNSCKLPLEVIVTGGRTDLSSTRKGPTRNLDVAIHDVETVLQGIRELKTPDTVNLQAAYMDAMRTYAALIQAREATRQ
jgi:hypothetical protein